MMFILALYCLFLHYLGNVFCFDITSNCVGKIKSFCYSYLKDFIYNKTYYTYINKYKATTKLYIVAKSSYNYLHLD